MTTEQRTEALLFWINKFGDQPELCLRQCTQLTTVWCSHLPSIAHFCLTGKLVRKTAFCPRDAYKEIKQMLSKAFNDRKTHKHLVKQLSSSLAANNDEKEIYKFLILVTFHIAICHEDMICKFRNELRAKDFEDVLGRMLQQCCDNIVGDSWFSVEMTPVLQRKTRSARKALEEVFTNVSSCDLNNTLSSPSFQKLRQKNIVIEKLEQENNVLRNQCEKNVKKANSYKEYLEEAEQQKESVSTELRSRINELNTDEKKLRMENKILLREKSALEHDVTLKEQKIAEITKELKELKSKVSDSKAEIIRSQIFNNKLRDTSDNLETTVKSLRKQLDEAWETIALNEMKSNEPKARQALLEKECEELKKNDKESKDEIKYLKEQVTALTSCNSDFKRQFLTLGNQLQSYQQRVDNISRDLENEKKNGLNALREQESNHTRLLEQEREINQDLSNQLKQAREKIRDNTDLYNTNIANEKKTCAMYKTSKEEAENKLKSLKTEWEQRCEQVQGAHKREMDALRQLKEHQEKKCQETIQELDDIKKSLMNLGEAELDNPYGSTKNQTNLVNHQELKTIKQLIENKNSQIESLHQTSDEEQWCKMRDQLVASELIHNYEDKLRESSEIVKYAFKLMNAEALKMESCLNTLDLVFEENVNLRDQLAGKIAKN